MEWVFPLAILLFFRRKNYNIYHTEYFYKSPEQFAEEQLLKHHPELLYQLATKQFEAGQISKAEYDKAIESLIKDITI